MNVLLESPETVLLLSVMLGLLLASGFFSSSETALFFLSREELLVFSRSNRVSERRVVQLLQEPDRLLTAVLFWNLLINMSYFACGVVISSRLLAEHHHTAAGGFGVLSLSLMIVVGEVLPKSLAAMFRQTLSRRVSLPLAVSVRLFDPCVPVFRVVTRSMRRMFWPQIPKEQYIDPEDLEQAIDNSAGNLHVVRQERTVLHNILDMSEIPVEEVMRPRGTYLAMHPPVHLSHLRKAPIRADYLVVLHGQDEVVGAVPLARFAKLPEQHLEHSLENVVHAPWCATVASVLKLMQSQHCSLAAIVNEYGETVGIVTYEDIVDTILASEPSRAKRVLKRDPVLEIAPDRWHVDGITSLRYLSRRLKVSYTAANEGQVTIAGVFYEMLERLPEAGDECVWRGLSMKVIEVIRPGRFRVLITRLP